MGLVWRWSGGNGATWSHPCFFAPSGQGAPGEGGPVENHGRQRVGVGTTGKCRSCVHDEGTGATLNSMRNVDGLPLAGYASTSI